MSYIHYGRNVGLRLPEFAKGIFANLPDLLLDFYKTGRVEGKKSPFAESIC